MIHQPRRAKCSQASWQAPSSEGRAASSCSSGQLHCRELWSAQQTSKAVRTVLPRLAAQLQGWGGQQPVLSQPGPGLSENPQLCLDLSGRLSQECAWHLGGVFGCCLRAVSRP